MGSNPSHFKGDDDRPVENVSWDDIQVFESKTGHLLPAEAQWEYACRAWTTTPFAGTGKLDQMGWYDGNTGSTTYPVGKKAPNNFGLYDMHGNVWEWCEDLYDMGFYGKPVAVELDAVATSDSEERVVRGGCWGYDAGACRSSDRRLCPPAAHDGDFGFRPAWRFPYPLTAGSAKARGRRRGAADRWGRRTGLTASPARSADPDRGRRAAAEGAGDRAPDSAAPLGWIGWTRLDGRRPTRGRGQRQLVRAETAGLQSHSPGDRARPRGDSP
jgi:hypothetical protein